MKKIIYICLAIVCIIVACNKKDKNVNSIQKDSSNIELISNDTLKNTATIVDSTSIEFKFYGKYSLMQPIDLQFNTENLKFTANSLMTIPTLANQSEESAKATLLGMFTADMLYALNFNEKKILSQYYSAALDYAYNLGIKDIYTLETIKLINSSETTDTINKVIIPNITKMFQNLYKTNSTNIFPFLVYGFYLEYSQLFTNTLINNKSVAGNLTQKFNQLSACTPHLVDYYNEVMLSLDDFDQSSKIQNIIDEIGQLNDIQSIKTNEGSLTNDQLQKITYLLGDIRKNVYKTVDEKIELNYKRKKSE